jgi:hypothetical protein
MERLIMIGMIELVDLCYKSMFGDFLCTTGLSFA